ncbi:hypothetical protein EYR41_002924 [Orbilia oligospora]|uniref:Uncharacterized protein n=1 Tax=Orbilia oligospora TaxID=2813651 RepID=A0A7C8KI15_ORBOL|nr:hypothetical protein TWF751_004815 [Orbilia oligospora]TGJ70913.1 hypothetical protein EYR41_002924 [Orbilia oligospora]
MPITSYSRKISNGSSDNRLGQELQHALEGTFRRAAERAFAGFEIDGLTARLVETFQITRRRTHDSTASESSLDKTWSRCTEDPFGRPKTFEVLPVEPTDVLEDIHPEQDTPKPLYEIEKILNKTYKGRGKHVQYLVQWKGLSAKENQWISYKDINAPELVEEFEATRAAVAVISVKLKRKRGRPRKEDR